MEEILRVDRQEETPAEWWEGTSYEDAKAIIRSNMDNVARNSVAIGYYLRSIREKQQYLEGGYQSFDAFVQTEYSMSYSAASRLIGLCERFSRGGNSPVLADNDQGYSKSLLVEMLPMSDEQLEQVQPGMTVADVREIKREAREEAVPEPDPEPPAEEPEVVFQLAGEAETISRQEVVERLEAVMPAPVEEAAGERCQDCSSCDDDELCCECDMACIRRCDQSSEYQHNGVWFASQMLEYCSLIKEAPEVFADMERPDSVLAKMLQEKVAPNGYSGFSNSEIDIQFLGYAKGVDCAVGKDKHHWTYIQLIKDLRTALADMPKGQEEPAGCAHDRAGACTEMVLSDPDVAQPCVDGPCPAEEEPVATSQLPVCVMGYAESGICGAAAYCGQPYRCCLQCDMDCNGRCGWIPKQEAIPEPEAEQKSEPKRNPAMETQARMCLSNLQVEIGAKAWPVALSSARHLVHDLSLVVGEKAPEIATSQRQDIWIGLLHDMPLFSRQSVRDYVEDAEIELKGYLDCEGLPPTTVLRKKMIVAGLRLLLRAVEEREGQ